MHRQQKVSSFSDVKFNLNFKSEFLVTFSIISGDDDSPMTRGYLRIYFVILISIFYRLLLAAIAATYSYCINMK